MMLLCVLISHHPNKICSKAFQLPNPNFTYTMQLFLLCVVSDKEEIENVSPPQINSMLLNEETECSEKKKMKVCSRESNTRVVHFLQKRAKIAS